MNLISVTSITSWASDAYARINPEVLEAAGDRGHSVHAALAGHLKGEWVPYPKEFRGYVDSGRRWIDYMKPEVVEVEGEYEDKTLEIIGHPDLFCRISGHRAVVDWKTSQQALKTWEMQLAAYGYLVSHGLSCFYRLMTIRLSPDGKMPRVDEWNYARGWAAFLCALNLYRYLSLDKKGE